jgi:hypothetical protein
MSGGPANLQGSVATGTVRLAQPGPQIKRLAVLLGRWLNEGHIVDADGTPGDSIFASDIYEWTPGGFFVIHHAYGRIGDVGVGGIEIIGYDPTTGAFRTHFFDSHGNTSQQTLTPQGDDTWLWEGGGTRCTGVLSDRGRTMAAHHERRTEDGSWVPSMEVVLTKIG